MILSVDLDDLTDFNNTTVRILDTLSEQDGKELSVSALSEELDASQPYISKEVMKMEDMTISPVVTRLDDNKKKVKLNTDVVQEV